MADSKTKPTGADVKGYFSAIADESRRKDCEALAKLMAKATREPPRMWGTSIVGFGSYHYKCESGKGCLYLRGLDGVDERVLEKIIVESAAARKRDHAD